MLVERMAEHGVSVITAGSKHAGWTTRVWTIDADGIPVDVVHESWVRGSKESDAVHVAIAKRARGGEWSQRGDVAA